VKLAVLEGVKPLTGLKTTIIIILNRQICELRDQAGKGFSCPFSPQLTKMF